MRTLVTKDVEFDAGHRVPDHGSKCRNPHGHRYKVAATVEGDIVNASGRSDNGMVVDFGDLKAWLVELVHDRYDHGFIVYDKDHALVAALANQFWRVIHVPWVPTAENLAVDTFRRLAVIVEAEWPGCYLEMVEVWETPTSRATVLR